LSVAHPPQKRKPLNLFFLIINSPTKKKKKKLSSETQHLSVKK